MGIGGGASIDGEQTVEPDGISLSEVNTEEGSDDRGDYIIINAVIENTVDAEQNINFEGAFYDADGAELQTEVANCETIDANGSINKQVMGTYRVDEADRYELTITQTTRCVI